MTECDGIHTLVVAPLEKVSDRSTGFDEVRRCKNSLEVASADEHPIGEANLMSPTPGIGRATPSVALCKSKRAWVERLVALNVILRRPEQKL